MVQYQHILCGQGSGILLGHLLLGPIHLATLCTPLGAVFGLVLYATFLFWKKVIVIVGPGPENLAIGNRCLHLGLVSGFCMILTGHYTTLVSVSLIVLVLVWIAVYLLVRLSR